MKTIRFDIENVYDKESAKKSEDAVPDEHLNTHHENAVPVE